jgi:hypothetical protein
MPRIRLPKDWKHRATRALSNLKKPGVGAVCFWCGHQYRSGEYSRETESAHLLQCPEYPQDAKRKMQKRKDTKPTAPKVGIIYLVGGKLLIDSTPLAQAGSYGNSAIHERDHISYWAELVQSGRVPNSEYEEFPRGRVAFDTKSGKFRLLADKCILSRKGVVSKILSGMNLPPKDTETGTDSHYRCFRCLRRQSPSTTRRLSETD